jgi:hypothetical protein
MPQRLGRMEHFSSALGCDDDPPHSPMPGVGSHIDLNGARVIAIAHFIHAFRHRPHAQTASAQAPEIAPRPRRGLPAGYFGSK